MFQTISWQAFFIAIAFIAVCYYAISTILFYRAEIGNIFTRRESKSIAAEINEDQSDSNEINDLMGGAKNDHGTNVSHEIIIEPDEIKVTPSEEAEKPIEWNDSLANAFKRIKVEIEIIAEGLSRESKDESILLLKSLLSRYSQLIETPYEEQVNLFIQDLLTVKCSIQIESIEIKSWWTEAEVSTDSNQ